MVKFAQNWENRESTQVGSPQSCKPRFLWAKEKYENQH
jgi:hypothetical protein